MWIFKELPKKNVPNATNPLSSKQKPSFTKTCKVVAPLATANIKGCNPQKPSLPISCCQPPRPTNAKIATKPPKILCTSARNQIVALAMAPMPLNLQPLNMQTISGLTATTPKPVKTATKLAILPNTPATAVMNIALPRFAASMKKKEFVILRIALLATLAAMSMKFTAAAPTAAMSIQRL